MTATTPPGRRAVLAHLGVATMAALTAEVARRVLDPVATPAARAVAGMPTPRPGPGALLATVVALAVLNGWVVGRWLLDPDDQPPLVGRVAVAAICGVPLTLAQLAIASVAWLALT